MFKHGEKYTSRLRDVLWCNLVRFGVYLDQILSLKNLKNYYFLYKNSIYYHFFL